MRADPAKTIALLQEIADHKTVWYSTVSMREWNQELWLLHDMGMVKCDLSLTSTEMKEGKEYVRLTARGQRVLHVLDGRGDEDGDLTIGIIGNLFYDCLDWYTR